MVFERLERWGGETVARVLVILAYSLGGLWTIQIIKVVETKAIGTLKYGAKLIIYFDAAGPEA